MPEPDKPLIRNSCIAHCSRISLFVARDEFLHGVDAALLQHEVARGGFHQHGEVASCHHREFDLADLDAEYFLEARSRQSFQFGKIVVRRTIQMHDELETFLAPHRCLAEHGADVEHAQTAHFEKVAQQFRAASFQRFGRDAVQFGDVVGHQAAAARDEFQRQFAFAHAAVAGDHHADTEHVEEHAVARGGFGQCL